MGDFRKIVTGRGLILLLPCVISILTEEQGVLEASGHGLIAGAPIDALEISWCESMECGRASNVGFVSVARSCSDKWVCIVLTSFKKSALFGEKKRANLLWKLEFMSWNYAEIRTGECMVEICGVGKESLIYSNTFVVFLVFSRGLLLFQS
jgi:hypothetical protein